MGDTIIMLENLGHQLDLEVQPWKYDKFISEGMDYRDVNAAIEKFEMLLSYSSQKRIGMVDAICGMLGHGGDSFVFHDPNGIRPAFIMLMMRYSGSIKNVYYSDCNGSE